MGLVYPRLHVNLHKFFFKFWCPSRHSFCLFVIFCLQYGCNIHLWKNLHFCFPAPGFPGLNQGRGAGRESNPGLPYNQCDDPLVTPHPRNLATPHPNLVTPHPNNWTKKILRTDIFHIDEEESFQITRDVIATLNISPSRSVRQPLHRNSLTSGPPNLLL